MNDHEATPVARRTQVGFLIALMVAGFFLRLDHAESRILDHDEAFSWRVASRPFGTMVRQVAGDTHPLLHFLVLKVVLLCGASAPLALRLPSIAIGVATIWAVYALSLAAIRFAGRWDGPPQKWAGWAGLAAAAYVTFHPFHIRVSNTARMYPFAAFFVALSSWLLLVALRANPPSRLRYAAYAASAALLLHSHNFGIFIVLAQFCFALGEALWHRTTAIRLRGLAEAGTLILLLYLPWLPSFLAQARRVHDGFWIPPLTWDTFGEILVKVVFGGDTVDRPIGVILACSVVAFLTWTAYRSGGARPWYLPIQVFTPWVLATLISTMGGRPILQDRYLILICPVFAGWFAFSLANSKAALPRSALTLNLLLPTGLVLLTGISQPPEIPLSTLEAISYLRDVHKPGDVVLVGQPGIVNVLRYYQSRTPGRQLDVRYALDRDELNRLGQFDHLSSFDDRECVDEDDSANLHAGRLWVVNNARHPKTDGWTRGESLTFGDSRGEFLLGVQIVCYSKSD